MVGLEDKIWILIRSYKIEEGVYKGMAFKFR